jgi:hypothetical protein
MADSKISALSTLATSAIAAGDLIPIVDVSDTSMSGSGTNKVIDANKVAYTNIANTFTADQSISGSVGIGTTSPSEALDVYNATGTVRINAWNGVGAKIQLIGGSNSGAVGTGTAHDLIFLVNANTKMIIKVDGKVGIGTLSPSYTLDVSGDINASGSVRSAGTPLTSDGTLKDAPTPTKGALSKLAAVRGYEFTWSDKARQMGLPDGVQHGLIAQEVEQIFPDLVSEWEVDTGEYVEGENGEQTPVKERIKCIDYARMVPILLEAVRELAARVDALNDTDPTTKE